MPTNTAAWTRAKHARLEVGPAPYTAPGPDQIVVRNHAVAVNPLEWIIQVAGNLAYRWLRYPTVLGSDLAGEVVEVGSDVTRFAVGDRVLGHAVGTDKDSNRAAEGSFQRYTVVLERMAAPLPDTMSYEDAAVLPLAVSTASCGLFQQDQLALRLPSLNPEQTGETVVVWGGSTSVGSNAIQLAVAAGYTVITTASLEELPVRDGPSVQTQVFDYHSRRCRTGRSSSALDGRTCAGAIAFGTTSAAACVAIVGASSGRKVVAIGTPPVSFEGLADDNRSRTVLPGLIWRLVSSNVRLQVAARRHGVRTRYIFGTSLKKNDVSRAIYADFLPAALANGTYVPAPAPLVVGHGLDAIQHALDVQLKGVSAQKVVVSLSADAE